MPKKTQKGAGNTDEENFLQLQQRVQAEQEMSKKKEETLTLFLKDKLQREERYTAVNRPRVMDDWRTTLRQTKAAELRREAEVMRQTSEREQDELDAVIQKLNRELLGAERQTAQVQCNHLQHLDRLQTQQERHVSWLQERWEGALEELRSRNHAEKKRFLALSEQRNQKFAEQVVVAKQRSSDMMEDYRRRHEKMMAFCESLMPLDGDESDELEELDNPGVTSLANSVSPTMHYDK
ncbi:dynein regulatory complex subunit 2 [Cololabis saira]|uniref:dynein regulatory complex subunit 2 n=1 Tax=Cololabis saira TaxID=129043 RepID=UPI002AD36B58|nr:dynein regulatory complex subunit 2 [Cololabis saira]